jgi:hypothetical protein
MSDPPSEPPAVTTSGRGRWVAIVTGAISVLIGVLYLAMIVVLDSRGPLQPPPPEALGELPVSRAQALAADSAVLPVAVAPPG